MSFKEIEFKYDANKIPLSKFIEFCTARADKYASTFTISSYDHFYSHPKDSESFYRHRKGNFMNQLTFKRKSVESDSFIRTEHNIDLDNSVTEDKVAGLVAEHGYNYDTSIYKTSVIYNFGWYIAAYYICYDLDMNETGRFCELELNEDHNWASEKDAWSNLILLEKSWQSLGISASKRIKRSLFEMYRKVNK